VSAFSAQQIERSNTEKRTKNVGSGTVCWTAAFRYYSTMGQPAGRNGNNHWDWKWNGNETWLNLGAEIEMGMNKIAS